MKIIPVDCHYVEPEFAASFLLVNDQRGMFVECNTNHAIPYLEAATQGAGLRPGQVEGLVITHVHLDHAGGAGKFLEVFPKAKLCAHPRAARHLIDPSRLVSSATAVYGEAFMEKLYGQIIPCPPDRVVALEDGDTIPFQKVSLVTKHLRGHANHHLVVTDPVTKTLFSGDAFGVAYPKLSGAPDQAEIILASTSPTDFDAEAAWAAVDWIENQDLEQVALTHYGFIPRSRIRSSARILKDEIDFSARLLPEIKEKSLAEEQVTEILRSFVQNYFAELGRTLEPTELQRLELDLKINARGLVYAAHR